MIILFLGPPGSGKGTQAKRLSHSFGLAHLSTGDMFRTALHSKTPIGLEMKEYMDRGDLVPDHIVIRLIEERVQHLDCRSGFILDGFPRTIPQAESLDAFLQRSGKQLFRVIFFKIPDIDLIERLSQRRVCSQCGEMFHLIFRLPKREDQCDLCSCSLVHREDDQPQVIQKRLQVYHHQTEPLVEFYRKQGRLSTINACLLMEEVSQEVLRSLGK